MENCKLCQSILRHLKSLENVESKYIKILSYKQNNFAIASWFKIPNKQLSKKLSLALLKEVPANFVFVVSLFISGPQKSPRTGP